MFSAMPARDVCWEGFENPGVWASPPGQVASWHKWTTSQPQPAEEHWGVGQLSWETAQLGGTASGRRSCPQVLTVCVWMSR